MRIKNKLDIGKNLINQIYDYEKINSKFPKDLDKFDIVNKNSGENMDFMNCCVEYSVNDSTLLKIEDNEGYHYEGVPGESFTLIIWPEDFPRYFIYNSNEKKFRMAEIQFSKKLRQIN